MQPLFARPVLRLFLGLAALGVLAPACGDDGLNKLVPILVAKDGSAADSSGKAQYLVDFGEIPTGGQGTQTFYARNNGRATLNLAAPTVAAPFTTELTEAVQLAPQTEKGVYFIFSPTEEGPAEQVVTLESDGGSLTLRLVGVGRKPLPTDCSFDVAPTQLAFGPVGANQSKTLEFRIVNKGQNPCTVTHLALGPGSDAGYAIEGGAVATATVGAFDELTVQVTFKPLRFAASFTGSVKFAIGPPDSAQTVNLTASSPEPCPGALPDGSCPVATEKVYVNNDSTLYKWDPTSNALSKIGDFKVNGRALAVGMTDIAIDGNGTMIGVDQSKNLYVINPTSAACGRLASISNDAQGLTFLPDGRLVASGAGVWAIDRANGHTTQTLVPAGRYATSGDIIGLPDGKLYWAVKSDSGAGNDRLVQIDPADGQTTVVGNFSSENIYGLAYANGSLYGYTDGGKVLTVDPSNAHTSATRNLSGTWWGATTNPVTWGE